MFRTLKPFDQKKITLGKIFKILAIITGIVIVLTLILAMFPQFFRYKDRMLEATFTMNMVLIVLILLNFVNYILFRGKEGNFMGNLELKENEIVLNGDSFPLENISKIRFIGNDIKGQFRGFSTKGTENSMILKTNNGQEIKVNFEQTLENNLKKYSEILKIYHNQNKLSEANYDNILNNTNYY